MNFDQLRYVKEIVETKSISIAAQNLYMTQSAISQSISLLEKEIGVKLFKRSRIGSIPTDEGKIIIEKILEILEKEDELLEASKIINSDFIGELKIATSPSILMTFLLKSLLKFKNDYPQIKISIIEKEKEEIILGVKEDVYDVGLTFLFEPIETLYPQMQFNPLNYSAQYNVLVPVNSSLSYKKKIKIKDIQKYPYILYERNYILNLIKEIETTYGEMNIILRTNNTEIMKKAVAEGLGITIASSLLTENDPYISTNQIIAIPLEDYPQNVNLKIGGIFLESSNKKTIIKAFLEYLHI